MNKLFNPSLILLSLFLFSFTEGNKKKNDWDWDHLKGKVKSVKYYYFDKADKETLDLNPNTIDKTDIRFEKIINYNRNGFVRDNIGSNNKKTLICKYDNYGNNVESTTFDSFQHIIDIDSSWYDKNGNLIEHIQYQYSNPTYKYKQFYKYDDKGNKIEMISYTDDSFNNKYTYIYDKNGIETEEDNTYTNTSIDNKQIFKYDEKGYLSEVDAYDGLTEVRFVFKHNNQGSVEEESRYDSNNNMVYDYQYKWEYDEKGNWIKKIKTIKKDSDNNDRTSIFVKEKTPAVEIRVIEYFQ